jgi:hypothetical protein
MNMYLGSERPMLMSFCDQGRQFNSMGISYWSYENRESRRRGLMAAGFSSAEISKSESGQAAAMAKVCPGVT